MKRTINSYKTVIYSYILLLFPMSIGLPLDLKVKSIFLILFLFVLLLNGTLGGLKDKENIIIIFLFFSLFIIESVTGYVRERVFVINEIRLSFIFAPILFFSAKKIIQSNYSKIIVAFLFGVYLYIFYCICYVIYFYVLNDSIDFAFNFYLKYVLYHYLPGAIHHTYMGMYIAFSMIIILFGVNSGVLRKIILSTPLLLAVIIIGSKTSLFIVYGVFLFWLVYVLWNFSKTVVFALLFCLIGSVTICFFKTDIFRTFGNSFNYRVQIYECTINGIFEHWGLGVGKHGVKMLIKSCTSGTIEMDTHNIFLQEFLSTGIFGFLLLVFLFVKLLIKSQYTIVLNLFIIMFLCFGLVEHLFNTQLGLTFFIFFLLLLLVTDSHKLVISNFFQYRLKT